MADIFAHCFLCKTKDLKKIYSRKMIVTKLYNLFSIPKILTSSDFTVFFIIPINWEFNKFD